MTSSPMIAVLVALLMGALPAAIEQAVPGTAWSGQVNRIQAVTMRVVADDARCQSAVIVGERAGRVFALTAQSDLLAEVESALRLRSRSYEGQGRPASPLAGRVLEQGEGAAMIAIDDANFARWVAGNVRFDVLGDDSKVMQRDQVYFPGCLEALQRETPKLTPVMRVQNGRFAFQGGEVAVDSRESFVGAPLVQAFGDHLLVVGLVANVAERSEAMPLAPQLQRATGWGATVSLTSPASSPGCQFRVGIVKPDRGAELVFGSTGAGEREITVETTPRCTWTAFTDGSNWVGLSSNGPVGATTGTLTGSGVIKVTPTRRNPCDAPFRRGAINVAGQVIRVAQDNTSC